MNSTNSHCAYLCSAQELTTNTMAFQSVRITQMAGGQSIQLPEGLHIDDDRVYVKKVGTAIYLIPFHDPWKTMFDSLDKFSEDFMDDRAQPDNQSRESL